MFLGTDCSVENMAADGSSFSLVMPDNVLATFVELPPSLEDLKYSNIICGVIRGALMMINMTVQAEFVKDVLVGDETNEIKVTLEKITADEVGDVFKDE
ncbi:hypothetical protein TeGR_g35 [Tetraparma gracilis]|jgi:hypothetical protein|uniref:Trafficking protein particle complex subunit 3 n=1 Tax=Tetraparma gracilis TaxID=2962635 RepID=A0ABQ6MN81_9STRA|nr:hypothetical protein TeGR_g35 [Tetraparma gracilis]